MSERIKQINEQLRFELATAISHTQIMPDGLITVAQVKCSPNLKNATVIVSVLPEHKSGTALKLLRQNTALISRTLSKLNLKFIPKLNWKIDAQARFASDMDRVFNDLKAGKELS